MNDTLIPEAPSAAYRFRGQPALQVSERGEGEDSASSISEKSWKRLPSLESHFSLGSAELDRRIVQFQRRLLHVFVHLNGTELKQYSKEDTSRLYVCPPQRREGERVNEIRSLEVYEKVKCRWWRQDVALAWIFDPMKLFNWSTSVSVPRPSSTHIELYK